MEQLRLLGDISVLISGSAGSANYERAIGPDDKAILDLFYREISEHVWALEVFVNRDPSIEEPYVCFRELSQTPPHRVL